MEEGGKEKQGLYRGGEEKIVNELIECQGGAVDIGGYYKPDPLKVDKAMRPCALLNEILEKH